MKKRELNNKKLDEIGDKLLRSISAKDEEVDAIFGNPDLFDSIMHAINAEKVKNQSDGSSDATWILGMLNWQSGSIFGVLTVLLLVVGGFFVYDSTTHLDIPVERAEVFEEPAKGHLNNKEILISKPSDVLSQNDVVNEDKNSAGHPLRKRLRRKGKRKRVRKQKAFRIKTNQKKPKVEKDYGDPFYSLTMAINPNGDLGGKEIIRVETSRLALAALGANLSDVNDNRKITVDLLVGLDGMALAYRLVKQ